MILSMQNQATLFLTTVVIGLCAGLLYDVFRITRLYIKHSNIVIHTQDLIFWLAVAISMFYIVLNNFHGEFRGFYFLGAGLGMVIYFTALSRFFIRGACFAINIILNALRRIFALLFAPVIAVLRLLKEPFRKFLEHVKKQLQNLSKYAKIKRESFKRDIHVILHKI